MRWLAAAVLLVLVACGGSSGSSSSSPPTTQPGDLVPASATAAQVTVTAGGVTTAVPADAVARVVPFLVRRVFDAREPLASYGLDAPRATVAFAMPDGQRIELAVGAEEFDHTASYVQRRGDPRVWLVLDESLAPLGLSAAGAAPG